MPNSLPAFLSRSAGWRDTETEEEECSIMTLLRYAPTRLFGFRPQYRGWSQAACQLLFRAFLLDG